MATRHTHEHGNHTHEHVHVAGDLDHAHGWHHGPHMDQGDTVFGEEPDRPAVPTEELPVRLYGQITSLPLAVVPYVPGYLRDELVTRMEKIGSLWMSADVSGTEWDYFGLIRDMWADQEDFVIVEHDIVPHFDFLEQFAQCPEPFCGYSYWVHERGVTVADYAPGPPSTAMGCVRFRAEMMQRIPDLGEHCWPWYHLDSALYQLVRAHGFNVHRHYPDVEHLPRVDQDWRSRLPHPNRV